MTTSFATSPAPAEAVPSSWQAPRSGSVAPSSACSSPTRAWSGCRTPGYQYRFVGLLIARPQKARLGADARYAALAGIATVTELTALPTMFFLRESHPDALPAILVIADGAHLLILMWLHLDYTYFLAGNLKVVLGIVFLFTDLWASSYPLQLTAGGVVSLVAAALVWRDSSRMASLYLH